MKDLLRTLNIMNYKRNPHSVTLVKCNCMPSMRQNVMIGNHGKTAEFYSLHICVQKTSGYILQAACNCKADAAGLCAHIGALLYTLVKTKKSMHQ